MPRLMSVAFAFVLIGVLSLRTSPVSGTLLANVSIPLDRYGEVIAFGDCPFIDYEECSVTESEWCHDNNCEGEPGNPFAQCVNDCHVACHGAENFQDCVDDCIDDECDGLPNESVRFCIGPLSLDRVNRFPDGYEIRVEVDESGFIHVSEVEDKCYDRCECSAWCSNWSGPGQPANYVCDTTENCATFGDITRVPKNGWEAGECKTPEH